MTKKTDTPAIRFKGFSDTWEQRKLGEVLISLQNNTLSRADLSSEEGMQRIFTTGIFWLNLVK